MLRFSVGVVVLVSGCGERANKQAIDAAGDASIADVALDGASDAAPPDNIYDGPPVSGSRLKHQWIDFSGAKTHAQIYDSLRQERCSTQRWADGNDYCTPAHTNVILYGDAQCTNTVAVDLHSTGANYVSEAPVRCSGQVVESLRRIGEPLLQTEYYEIHPSGACIGPLPAEGAVRRTELVPVTDLVRLGHAESSAPGRLVQRWTISADGLRYRAEVRDRELGVDCRFERLESATATTRCVPSALMISAYADASCSERAGRIDATCPAPLFAKVPSVECGIGPPSFHAQGGVITELYEPGFDGVCRQIPIYPGSAAYRLGPELALPTTTKWAPAVPRITTVMQSYAGEEFEDGALYDNQLATECLPTSGPGPIRCVPRYRDVQRGFRDPLCQTPVIITVMARGTASCAAPDPGTYASASVPPDNLVRIGSEYTEPFYIGFPGCSVRPQPVNSIRFEVTAASIDELATGTLVIDP